MRVHFAKKNAGILYFLFCPKTPAFAFPESAGSVVGSICRNGRVFINFGQNRVQPRQRKKISRKKKPQNVRVFWNFRPPPSPPKNADIVRVFCFDATPILGKTFLLCCPFLSEIMVILSTNKTSPKGSFFLSEVIWISQIAVGVESREVSSIFLECD